MTALAYRGRVQNDPGCYDGNLVDVAALLDTSADPWWKSNAEKALETLIRLGKPFTVDDVFVSDDDHSQFGIERPEVRNHIGALIAKARNMRRIVWTGRLVRSRNRSRNGSHIREWIAAPAP